MKMAFVLDRSFAREIDTVRQSVRLSVEVEVEDLEVEVRSSVLLSVRARC